MLSSDKKTSVAGIDFGSSVSRSMARVLAGLPSAGDAPIKYTELMKSLKGARVEVKTAKQAFTGRLIDVLQPNESESEDCVPSAKLQLAGMSPKKESAAPCVLRKNTTLLLLTKSSEIRRFKAPDVVSVRPTDKGFSSRLGSALDALSVRGHQSDRALRLLAGKGEAVTLGYVAEAPLWRSTYRLVLDKRADHGTLQGWALVHNDTDEDWKRVDVELVNGQPDSFLFPLAAPRYARRQLVTPEQELSTVPQLLDKTVDNMWGDEIGDSFGAGGMGLSGVGRGGGGHGEGIGLGSVGTVGHGGGSGGLGSSSLLAVGNLANVAKADGVESGALFRYSLKNPIDLRARGSALVPFLQEQIAARRIAYFDRPGEPARSAVSLKNLTKQTLPAGPISIFSDGGFAGESGLDRMKPTESRILRYGFDLDVELTEEHDRFEDETRMLTFTGDQLVVHFIREHDVSYQIVNRSSAARTLYLALGYVNNASVEGADELDFDGATNRAVAVFRVGPKKQLRRRLRVEEGVSRHVSLKTLGSRDLRKLAASKKLPAAQKKLLLKAADHLVGAEIRAGAVKRRTADLKQIDNDLSRLRGHLKALGASRSGATAAIAKRLLAAEDKATRVRRRIDVLRREVDEHRALAGAVLKKLRP